MQRLREGHGEGGAAWLRTELEAKSTSDLRRLCAMLEAAAEARRQNPSEGAAAGIHSGQLLIAGGRGVRGWRVVLIVQLGAQAVYVEVGVWLDSDSGAAALCEERVVFGDGCLLLVSNAKSLTGTGTPDLYC